MSAAGAATEVDAVPVTLVKGDDPALVAQAAHTLVEQLVGEDDPSLVVEEFGMIGAALVFALFSAILFRGMRIAHEEPDPFASLLAVGLTAMISLQALVNMAVVIGLVPTKGLPLPFLSYGGTSMVMAMAALGALLALSRRPAVR